MNQKACPRCGWVSDENQYICPRCFFHFVVNPPSSKKSRNRMGKAKKRDDWEKAGEARKAKDSVSDKRILEI